MARTKQTARKIVAEKQQSQSSGVHYKNTNADILGQNKPKLLARQNDCLQGTVSERRERYGSVLKYIAIENILIWPQYFAFKCQQPQQPQKSVQFAQAVQQYSSKKAKSKSAPTGEGGDASAVRPIQSYYAYEPDLNEKVSIHDADISLLELDAIVVTSDTFLGRKEMADTVFVNAGIDLEKELNEMRKHGRVPEHIGNAVICAGYELPARYIIFVAPPTVMDDSMDGNLAACYSSALAFIPLYNIKTIAFPCLSTGGYACPVFKACPIVLKVVREWLDDPQNKNLVQRIVFCTYGSENLEEYKKTMHLFFPLVENGLRGYDMMKLLGTECQRIHEFFLQLKSKDIFSNCSGLSFAALGTALSDVVFWLMLTACPVTDQGVHVGWSSVTSINCTSCTKLTDAALMCTATIFPNLQMADFSGCISLTEPGIIRFLTALKCTMKSAKFVGIDGIRPDVVHFENGDGKRERRWKRKTKSGKEKEKETKRTLKLILLRCMGQAEGVPLQIENKNGIVLTDTPFNDYKVIDTDQGNLALISTNDSVVIIPDIPVGCAAFQQAFNCAVQHARRAPIVICSAGASVFIDKIKSQLEATGKDLLDGLESALASSYMQRITENFFQLSYLINQTPLFCMDPKKLTKFKGPEWNAIMQKAVQLCEPLCAPVQHIALPNIVYSNFLGSVADDMYSILQSMQQGDCFKVGNWYIKDISLLTAISELQTKNLNVRTGKRWVPWLGDDIDVVLFNELINYLNTQHNLDYQQIHGFCDALVEQNIMIALARPWLNDFKNIPVLINYESLPEAATMNVPANNGNSLHAIFTLAMVPPKGTIIHIVRSLAQYGDMVELSQTSVMFHAGCFQVLIVVSHSDASAKLDFWSSAMKMDTMTGLPQEGISKMKTTHQELFSLLFVAIIDVLNKQRCCYTVNVECPFCPESHDPLQISVTSKAEIVLKCIKSNTEPMKLLPILANNCAHNLVCGIEVESRCCLCLIEIDPAITSNIRKLCCSWCAECALCINCISNIQHYNGMLENFGQTTCGSVCAFCEQQFPTTAALKKHIKEWCSNRIRRTDVISHAVETTISKNIVKCHKKPKMVKFSMDNISCHTLQIIVLDKLESIHTKIATGSETLSLNGLAGGNPDKCVFQVVKHVNRYMLQMNKQTCIDIKDEHVEITIVLSRTGASILWIAENDAMQPAVITVKQGMLLEAKHPDTNELVVAKIQDFDDDANLVIVKSIPSFDSLMRSDSFQYTAHLHDQRFTHIDHSAHTAISVQLLKHYNMEPPFEWQKYAESVSIYGVPFDFFQPEQVIGETDMVGTYLSSLPDTNVHLLKTMMRCEAKDKQSGQVRLAHIKEIVSYNQIIIAFDGSIIGSYLCPLSSKDLHPLGFTNHINKQFGYSGEQKWENILKEMGAIPVPYEFFNEEQTQGCSRLKLFDEYNHVENGASSGTNETHEITGFLGSLRTANHILFSRNILERKDAPKSYAILAPVGFPGPDVTWPGLDSILDWSVVKQTIHCFCYDNAHSATGHFGNLFDFLPFRYANPHLFGFSIPMDKPAIAAVCSQEKNKKSLTMVDLINTVKTSLTKNLRFLIACKLTALQGEYGKDGTQPYVLEMFHRMSCLTYHAMMTLFGEEFNQSDEEEDTPDPLFDYMSSLVSSKMEDVDKNFKFSSSSSFCTFHKFGGNDTKNGLHIALSSKNAPITRHISLRDEHFTEADWYLATQKLKPMELDHLVSINYKPKDFDNKHDFEQLTNLLVNNKIEAVSYRGSFLKSIDIKAGAISLYTMTYLDLNSNEFKEFPPVICKMTNLLQLSLENCGLRKLPEEIANLSRLRYLELNGNCIQSLPEAIQGLKSLGRIMISGVPLLGLQQNENDDARTTFTWFMRHLGSHNLLNGKNKEQIEAEIEKFGIHNFSQNIAVGKDIKKVDEYLLSIAPRFDVFPELLCNLETLTFLDLSHCMFQTVPNSIAKLKNLNVVNFTNCIKLTTISEQIGALPIFAIDLEGCLELKTPPLEVVARGSTSIMAYMKRLLSGFQECKRTKLMLVGLGGAGKTSLVKALLSGQYKSNGTTAEEMTDGIDIAEWTVRLTVDEQDAIINYSVWDFAGQSVYYNTHQFFLSNRAVYLLVWNARLGYEHSGLNFWLSSIVCHAPKAPIFVIGTHADQVYRADLPHAELRRAFPQIVDFYLISALSGDGVQELALALYSATLAQKYMGEKIPSIWLKFERELIEMRKTNQVLPLDDVAKRALSHGLMDMQEIREALTLLHELGSLQYFPNEFLKERIVINPQWLVNVMACLISVKESVIKDGKFNQKDLALIWSEYAPELHDWLLYLTEEFDLTYSLPSENTSVVPCLLPEDEPPHPDEFADKNQMKMRYEFEYLPAGLFNRMQTRLSQYSDSALVWKKGTLLRKNAHVALLRQWAAHIEVTVAGPKPQNILFLVHEVLDSLVHEFFRGIRFDVLVPCCDCLKAGSYEPHMFSSKQIKKAREMQAPFLQCSQGFHIVALDALKELLPPNTTADFELHLMAIAQDLGRLQTNAPPKILLLGIPSDLSEKSNYPIRPHKILTNLKKKQITIITVDLATDEITDIAIKINSCGSIAACITNDSCRDKKFIDILSYCKQNTNKPLIPLVFSSGDDWKTTAIGLQVTSDVYLDFRKPERYDSKFKELMTRIETKIIQNSALKLQNKPSRKFTVFFSYCWSNSKQAVKLGSKSAEGSLGPVDPRDIENELSKKGISVWIDVKCAKEGILFEEITIALRDAKLFIACVSDQYLASKSCMMEFRFAAGVLKLPIILCSVGTGNNWQTSEIVLRALGAPRLDMQIESTSHIHRLAIFIEQILGEHGTVMNDGNDKTVEVMDSFDQGAYQELCELQQRKFLQQIIRITTKLRSTNPSFSVPYPRLFYLDLVKPMTKTPDNFLDFLNTLNFKDLQLHLLCEMSEGSWHSTGAPLKLKNLSESLTFKWGGVLQDLFQIASPYLSLIFPILQAISYNNGVHIRFLKLDKFANYLHQMKQIALDQDLEASYSMLHGVLKSLDTNKIRGNMLRSSLHNRQIVWLCPEHQKLARGTIPNDSIDTEDIGLDLRPTTSQGPKVSLIPDKKRDEANKHDELIKDDPRNETKSAELIVDPDTMGSDDMDIALDTASSTSLLSPSTAVSSRPASSLGKLKSKLCVIS